MMSSAKHQRNHRISVTNKNKILNTVSSISSSSPSSSSSSLHSSQDSQEAQKSSLITMEEVWEDIHHLNRHSQHPQHNHEPRFRSHNHQNPDSIFQDFLNGPLNHEPTIPMGSSSNGHTTTVTALFSSSPLPPPATVLSLNSGAGFEFLDNQDPLVTSNLHSHNHLTDVPSFNTSLEDFTCFGKKRGQESNEGSGNRRHKRMIKNRESAALKNGGSKSATKKEDTSTVFHSSILRNLQVLISLLVIERGFHEEVKKWKKFVLFFLAISITKLNL
ncbi:hypothetical protein YC2023_000289 [Brassica napus]